MNQDDPEKRIAGLEHRLAEQNQRRFVATVIPSARQRYATFGSLFAVSAVYPISQEFKGGFDLLTDYGTFIFPAMLVALAVLWGLALRRLFMKKVVLCVTTDGLTVDQRPGETFLLRDAELGQWRGGWGRGSYRAGRALCLTAGSHRFVLADGDSHPTREVPIEGPQVKAKHLDAWTTTPAFDELLAIADSAPGKRG